MTPEVQAHVERLWAYLRLGQPLEPADVMLVLCSHDLQVADYAAEVFLEGWVPLVIFSGGLGTITRTLWDRPEADRFADIAAARGVPRERILIENRSTNTGENVAFSRSLLAARRIEPARVLLVQKPYMERRSLATFMKLWPGTDVRVTSPPVSMADYLARYASSELSPQDVISIMVGDLQRIRVYADRGFQVPQPIPDEVWGSFEALVRAGFDSRLVEPA